MAEVADILSFVPLVVGDTTVSSLLETLHTSVFGLNVLKNTQKYVMAPERLLTTEYNEEL